MGICGAFEWRDRSPLIRPYGPPSPRGEKGTEASRHIPFSPAGRRWRQPDEGPLSQSPLTITSWRGTSAAPW
ncbi:hypothetical protein ELH73_32200 [Rhizobium leguminosarum]|uniref:Uncharacterized protein n=1 Tax=Rhizobium leguminosarum TaxID=384 RepID=A0ABD7PHB3_RHILE|nr:hypothetical protein ELI28_31080 [Rhizobium leguminosarum]TAV66289.1 hypothetical protein ELI27_28830 [Rhizobium leguminosarum]TAW19333.1 hypothetical protein ELI19_29445 [Rhizobium leguminosarum]TAW33030.1 hypothetical protein ELI18_31070 [Rhizobium leguminosarum]TAZ23889.1 hypothetical protein ELH73_32200 [Rhizobium leguminosarum]